MLYAILAVACYVATSVSQKTAAQRGLDAVGVNLVLRVSGAVLTAALLLAAFDWSQQPRLLQAGLVGLAGGVCAFVAGYAGLRALSFGSLNATWSLLRVSTVIPVLASIVIWGELQAATSVRQVVVKLAGVVCLLAAMVLLGARRDD